MLGLRYEELVRPLPDGDPVLFPLLHSITVPSVLSEVAQFTIWDDHTLCGAMHHLLPDHDLDMPPLVYRNITRHLSRCTPR
jgi:hypothetical protein